MYPCKVGFRMVKRIVGISVLLLPCLVELQASVSLYRSKTGSAFLRRSSVAGPFPGVL